MHRQKKPIYTIEIEIEGLGLIIYSPFATKNIGEGEDYLTSNYMSEDQVQVHVQKGTIVGFGTGSPGRYIIDILEGYPEDDHLDASDFKLRLGIEVKNEKVCIRDLYDLMEWTSFCPPEHSLFMKDGFYHITLCSNKPESGLIGDNQTISAYFNKLSKMPALSKMGIPTLIN